MRTAARPSQSPQGLIPILEGARFTTSPSPISCSRMKPGGSHPVRLTYGAPGAVLSLVSFHFLISAPTAVAVFHAVILP